MPHESHDWRIVDIQGFHCANCHVFRCVAAAELPCSQEPAVLLPAPPDAFDWSERE